MNVVPRESRINSKALPKNKNEFVKKDSSLGKVLIHSSSIPYCSGLEQHVFFFHSPQSDVRPSFIFINLNNAETIKIIFVHIYFVRYKGRNFFVTASSF